jgi:hypothetical protein
MVSTAQRAFIALRAMERGASLMTEQTWEYIDFTPAEGTAGVISFLNEPLRQGPGEASMSARNDGSVGLFYLAPGSSGTSTTPTWEYIDFTPAQGTAGAVNFLNEALRQGPGEASATPRSDGSVGLFYLAPGSSGTSATPTWAFQNFPTVQAALTFLNEAPRLGSGQVSAIARNDGSVGLFYLEPGGLGAIATPTWMYQDFIPAQGTAGAVNFLNEAPRQGPGEASAFARNDGSVSLFYLERAG